MCHASAIPPSRTDPQLIAACLEKDQDAWRELIDRYSPLVLSIPRRNGLGPEAAEEVAQETFAQLVKSLPALRNQEGLPKWLMTTAFRYTLRAKRRRAATTGLDRAPMAALEPEDVTRWEQRQRINEALRSIGDRCRDLLIALYTAPDRPSYDLIAKQFDMPRGSIGPTRSRCLKKLLDALHHLPTDTSTENKSSTLSGGDAATHLSRDTDART
ncbi:MAG: sigma-70 family RNA polymerase sigma factor [Phycisphaerales bacterium]|nr:sigma-70 family RNA polymerase sigma factor [Phycisphaerales bacterium]